MVGKAVPSVLVAVLALSSQRAIAGVVDTNFGSGGGHAFGGGGFGGWDNSENFASDPHFQAMAAHFAADSDYETGHGGGAHAVDFGGHQSFDGGDAGYGGGFGGFELVEAGGHSADQHDNSGHEDQAALSAVGLANLLTGGGVGSSHAHLASSGGSAYTISGPTQEIRSLHKVQLTNEGGHVLSKSAGHGGYGGDKVVFVKEPLMMAHGGGHGGWY